MSLTPLLKRFVEEHEADDIHTLALQASRYPDIDMELAIRQINGRKVAKEKIPSWYASQDILYPKNISLEQSSSEATARYKASLCGGTSMTDLTGGMGVDISFMAQRFQSATYVERQADLAEIAAHNFEALGLTNITVVNAEAEDYLAEMPAVDLIYIDPARRDNAGRKTVSIEDCTPNIMEMEDALEAKAENVMIKLSPMLDISLALKSLRKVAAVHVVSIGNEVKELLFVEQRTDVQDVVIHCVNLKGDTKEVFSFTKKDEDNASIAYATQMGKYLYEPNAAILKAGAYKSIATAFDVEKLHVSSHLYTSDTLIDFPGRRFTIDKVYSFNKKDIKELVTSIKQVNITSRNFPLSVEDIRKKTGLKEGGDSYIFATTLFDGKKVLVVGRKV